MSIKIQPTSKQLSSRAGLITIKELLKATNLRVCIENSLPRLKSGTDRSYWKFCDLLLGLVSGADCIDDMGRLSKDKAVTELCGGGLYTPKAYGDFLRSYRAFDIHNLQDSLIRFGFQMRRNLFPDDLQFVFDIDDTVNRQYGKKMQGVERNYQNIDCLDSLTVFDQYGIQYFIDVRPGNTLSHEGVESVIHRLMVIYKNQKEKAGRKWKVCIRVDRGFYTSGFMNACFAKHADVVAGVRQDEHYFPQIINQIHNWKETDRDDIDRIKFYDGRECEIGTTNFRPKKFARRMRYVVMRAKKEQDPMFPDYVDYDYYAFCTTYDEHTKSAEAVIRLYRGRGQVENHIKENKYGLDMKHYPCLKLDANRAYALIAAFAYNYMRYLSLARSGLKKCFLSKNIRFCWINIPCLVACTGRNVIFKYMNEHYREVMAWLRRIQLLRFEFA